MKSILALFYVFAAFFVHAEASGIGQFDKMFCQLKSGTVIDQIEKFCSRNPGLVSNTPSHSRWKIGWLTSFRWCPPIPRNKELHQAASPKLSSISSGLAAQHSGCLESGVISSAGTYARMETVVGKALRVTVGMAARNGRSAIRRGEVRLSSIVIRQGVVCSRTIWPHSRRYWYHRLLSGRMKSEHDQGLVLHNRWCNMHGPYSDVCVRSP